MKLNNDQSLLSIMSACNSIETFTTNLFVGPSLYFHQKALECYEKEFLSDRHLEYVYATLVAWGMHRMGPGGAKMPNYDDFKGSIIAHKEALEKLRDKRIEDITIDEIDSIIEELSIICFSIKGTNSKSHLVSGSKTLAHILPNIVCPIDRQYTCQFFGITPNSKNEQTIFKDVIRQMWEFYQNLHHIKLLKPILGQPFNESYPKIFDNLIIEYQKKNPSNSITSKRQSHKK